ncbi:hypothetical protein DICPUDRAFT_73725 [Dictyostelium purpureum]|uniref:folate gamma-glutamyl hydrolase n=1 Tax=Dictyostelium purpureum TaxID=5786 RepID=F1A4P5_DICPU|nr:uncharacterized protein DICPUDRAFT_73725 [Dictyostelium purpureum]EGC28835.1 hypothetical protein DICPUDRAFT_73725 [Dictyostelium purpureum]|eukprot:XP_003294635.1 hypothetical protein DICPUDRAFT_73725 [Dictyostelium purpureum]
MVVNDRPIIGVLTQPSASFKSYGKKYIMASYVKFVEMGGARVVPIDYDLPLEEQTKLYNKLNGILLPGGDVDFNKEHQYNKTLYHIWDYFLKTNNGGDYFPLWGTCLGLEEIVSVSGKSYDVLGNFPVHKTSLPISFTEHACTSRLYQDCSTEIINIFKNENVSWNNHNFGISPQKFNEIGLNKIFDILALNKDENGNTFVSAIEGKHNLPVFAVMSHPEKTFYSWAKDGTNHSKHSILANQHYSNFFVNECKKSSHQFTNQEEEYSLLIYNFSPVYSMRYLSVPVEQIYFFK